MSSTLVDLLGAFDWFVLVYFLILNSSYLALIGIASSVAFRELRRPSSSTAEDIFANPATPAISIVMGAHDERECIVQSVQAVMGLRYPVYEVVVVDDGSTDGTFDALTEHFALTEVRVDDQTDVPVRGRVRSVHVATRGVPLTVVRKENVSRRADALNAGINVARHPLVCCIDADSILERDALLRVARPFVDDPDRTVATGGSIRAVNGSVVHRGELGEPRAPQGWLARIQVVEYLRAFLLGRIGWSRLRALLIVSGAFGLYRRDALVAIGGFDVDSLGEDADVVVALHRRSRELGLDHRIEFVPEPVCWTELPATRSVLARQRRRWSHGLAQVLWKHRRMMANPRYGPVGVVALPYYLLFELLGPIVELVGVAAVVLGLALGVVAVDFALLFLVVAVLYGIAVSMAALLVEEATYRRYRRWRDLWVVALAAVLENLGYRQLHAWWRLTGLVDAMLGRQRPWGEMTRLGFACETTPGTVGH